MRFIRRLLVGTLLAFMLPAAACDRPADPTDDGSSQRFSLNAGTLNFPSLVSPIPAIIEAQELDKENGFHIELTRFSAISAYYAALATGEVDVIAGGPDIAQNLFLQGAEIQIVGSLANMSPMVVVSRNPKVRSVEDLKGHSLAATVGSSEFQILSIVAEASEIDLRNDVHLIDAEPPLVLAQLDRGRVDAGLIWGPHVALAQTEHPEYRVILEGARAWEELTGRRGVELALLMTNKVLETHPDAADRWIAAVKAAVDFIEQEPDAAARIVKEATGLEESIFLRGIELGRIVYEVRSSSDPQLRETLRDMFRRSVVGGFNEREPRDEIFYVSDKQG